MEIKKNILSLYLKKILKKNQNRKKITVRDLKQNLPAEIFYSDHFLKIVDILEKKGISIHNKSLAIKKENINARLSYDNLYMKEMSKYALLSEEEEINLVLELEKNEEALMQEISQESHFFYYISNIIKQKYKNFLKKENNPNIRKMLVKKAKKYLKQSDFLALKRDFKIPRSDILKIAWKTIARIEKDPKNQEKKERIIQLIHQIEKIQEQLINANLRLVLSIAKKYARRKSNNLFDLVQEGNLGLMKAVEMFYYHKGVRFAAYAKWWIKQSIIRSLYENSRHIKIPLHFIDAIKKLEEFINNYIQEHQEHPSIETITEKLSFSKKKVIRIMQIISKPISLDTPVFYKDSFVELKDTVRDKNDKGPYFDLFHLSVSSNIQKLLSGLSEREREIIIKRYGLEDGIQRTLDEVGYYFNLTRERIRQIEQKALEKLKIPSKIFVFKKLLEGEHA